jgi:MFS family permease
LLGTGFTLGGVSPTYWTFAASLALIGIGYLTFVNATNPIMQLSTEPSMRGRVMALRIGVGLGATPVGAPIVGWTADHFSPRWSLGVGAAAGFAAAMVGGYAFARSKRLATAL